MSAPSTQDRYTVAWGDDYAARLWDELLAPSELEWEGARVLDVGCHWGYLLKHLLEERGIAEGHGIDPVAHWEQMLDGSRPDEIPGLHLHRGRVGEIAALEPLEFDIAITCETVFLMRPTELHRALAWIYDHLVPGGRLIVNTRTYFAEDGADLARVLRTPLAHLLFPLAEIEQYLDERGESPPRYVNPSCATTYDLQFRRAGFETVRSSREDSSVSPAVLAQFPDRLGVYDPDELRTGALTVELRRPEDASPPDLVLGHVKA